MFILKVVKDYTLLAYSVYRLYDGCPIDRKAHTVVALCGKPNIALAAVEL